MGSNRGDKMVTDQPQKQVSPDEIITFAELLHRWPSDAYLKILKEVNDGNLKIYYVNQVVKDYTDKIDIVITDISKSVFGSTTYWMSQAWRFVFELSVVKTIEIETPDYMVKKLLPTINNFAFSLCSDENIEQLAAITIHLLCKFYPSESVPSPYYPSPYNSLQKSLFFIRRALYSEAETSECPPGPVLSWRIDKEKLYKLRNLLLEHTPEESLPPISQVRKEAQVLMENLKYELLEAFKTIYCKYPNLSNANLGSIFPCSKDKKITHTGEQSRGKALKNRLFAQYPELKRSKEKSRLLLSD